LTFSTLRFLIPPALLSSTDITFTGAESLFSRPLSVYEKLSHTNSFSFEKDGCSLKVSGHLKPAIFSVPGDVSSQFFSGLLFALPLLDGDSAIVISPPLESRPYIDLTLQALRSFGICAQWVDECALHIPGNQRYRATDISVEGDWSGAAFFAALNALGGDITVTGLDPESLQGDRICQQHLKALQEGCPEIDLSQCPDLGPILFAVAAAKNGARFTGIHRLRLKESDRITAMAQELSAFGVEVTASENTVVINPKAFHKPDRILRGHNDHRIVMALSILLTLTGGQITDAQAVRKSFPDFFDRLADLGITLQQEGSYE
jgi:3-phosphoshikimate 1-carboxyvinyltransferase